MKKILFSLLLAGLPFSASAAKHIDMGKAMEPVRPMLKTIAPFKPMSAESSFFLNSKSDRILADGARGTLLDSSSMCSYTFDNGGIEPLVYEPISKGILFAQRTVYAPATGSTVTQGALVLRVGVLNNATFTWASPLDVYVQEGTYPVWPSLAVVNPTNSTNVQDVSTVIYSPHYVASGTSTAFNGGLWVKNKNLTTESVVEEHKSPEENTPTSPQWWVMASGIGNMENGKPYAYFAGRTEPQETGGDGGFYGFARNEMSTADMGVVENGHIAAFAPDEFYVPEDASKIYGTQPILDNDSEGNLYACFNNLMNGKEFERTVMVRRTTGVDKDNILTWGAWDSLPRQAIVDYQTAEKMDTLIGQVFFTDPYSKSDFVVTGKDEYSFFTPTVIYKKTTDNKWQSLYRIVEIYKKTGKWGIRTVAPISANAPYSIEYNTTQAAFVLQENDKGFCIDAARTADNKNVVVKWIDYNADRYLYCGGQAIKVYQYNNGTVTYPADVIDTLNSTDVYAIYRGASETSWDINRKQNFTNDNEYDKLSVMPSVVPDLDHIPVLSLITNNTKFSSAADAKYKKTMNKDFVSMAWDHYQNFFFKSYKFGPAGVEDNNVASNDMLSIVPNPSNGVANVKLNLTEGGFATVRVYNEMGVLVSELASSTFNAGTSVLSLDASNLASGTYFVTITVNGKTETKNLNVIK